MDYKLTVGLHGIGDTMANSKRKARNPAGKHGAPVSLYPLSFKEAVAGLAQVKMPSPENKKPKPKRN
jgi:hypothetical protein